MAKKHIFTDGEIEIITSDINLIANFPKAVAVIGQLRSYLESNREDAERYRWLEKQSYVGVHPHTNALLWVIRGLFANTKSLAEDIDAARRENA